MSAGGDLAAQFELPQLHRHHDWMAALFARLRSQGRQISRDKDLGLATRVAARNQFQRLLTHARFPSNYTIPPRRARTTLVAGSNRILLNASLRRRQS